MVAFPSLGQVARLRVGTPVAGAAGNGVTTSGQDTSSWGGLRLVTAQRLLQMTVPGGSQHNLLQARDRHPVLNVGDSKHSADPSNSGIPNPLASGPARPALNVINRDLTWQIGTDHTTNEDNDAVKATTVVVAGMSADGRSMVGERAFALGTQGDPRTGVYGGTRSLYRPYGARGYVEGPPEGSPLDGPQIVTPGPPHGHHSRTVPAYVQTRQNYSAGGKPQQRPVRANRPANSQRAGQSYSQTVVHQGGQVPNPMPTQTTLRTPGMGGRWGR